MKTSSVPTSLDPPFLHRNIHHFYTISSWSFYSLSSTPEDFLDVLLLVSCKESIVANPDPRPRSEHQRKPLWINEKNSMNMVGFTGECWISWSSELPKVFSSSNFCNLFNYQFLPGAALLPWQYLVWSASLWSAMCIPRVTIAVPWLPVQAVGKYLFWILAAWIEVSTFKCPKCPTKSFNLEFVHLVCRAQTTTKTVLCFNRK